MKIKNCHVSDSIKFFEDRFLNFWELNKNYNINEPLVKFGCYDAIDVNLVNECKQHVIVCWAGSDSMKEENITSLKKENITHIVSSKWCENDLIKAGITDYKFLPIRCKANDDLIAEPLGDKIYVYTSSGSPEDYGSLIYNKLIEELGADNFILATAFTYNTEQYRDVLRKAFIGLRLVQHDGLSETVIELGLMGRKVIYNGIEPNALNYNSYDDILRHIERERKSIGSVNEVMHKEMSEYIKIDTSWMEV